MDWSIEKTELPLIFDWKISRNSSQSKTNFFVRFKHLETSGVGEVAFNVRYGESVELIEQKFADWVNEFALNRENMDLSQDSMFRYLETSFAQLEIPLSLRFGIESSYFHWLAQTQNRSVSEFLGLQTVDGAVTSFSLPILQVSEIREFIEKFNLQRFQVLKVKVGSEICPVEAVREVAKHYSGPLRVDANEAWDSIEGVLGFQEKVRDLEIQFLEQPLPADRVDEMQILKKETRLKLMADEAVTDSEVNSLMASCYHGINIKLMKSGGYLRAKRQLDQARALGLETMLGCMVETSVGIYSAMQLADGIQYLDLDGFLFLQKDPLGWVVEADGQLFIKN